MSGIGGRWAVVSVVPPRGDTIERVGEWGTYNEALHDLNERLKVATPAQAFALATCEACGSSNEGCSVCANTI